jgi:hypothetical protein
LNHWLTEDWLHALTTVCNENEYQLITGVEVIRAFNWNCTTICQPSIPCKFEENLEVYLVALIIWVALHYNGLDVGIVHCIHSTRTLLPPRHYTYPIVYSSYFPYILPNICPGHTCLALFTILWCPSIWLPYDNIPILSLVLQYFWRDLSDILSCILFPSTWFIQVYITW